MWRREGNPIMKFIIRRARSKYFYIIPFRSWGITLVNAALCREFNSIYGSCWKHLMLKIQGSPLRPLNSS